MKRHYIDNRISVDLEKARFLCNNNKLADARVELFEGRCIELEETIHWLTTNGDPVLIHEDNLKECAETLCMPIERLAKITDIYFPTDV